MSQTAMMWQILPAKTKKWNTECMYFFLLILYLPFAPGRDGVIGGRGDVRHQHTKQVEDDTCRGPSVVRELDVIDNTPLACEGKSYSGKYLMEHGLEMPLEHNVDWGKKNDWSSRVLYLEAQ
jgi:hypothetical protein